MKRDPGLDRWDARFAQEGFLFGEKPNAFLASQKHRLHPGMRALAVADGEGRNGVWLAEQGLDVLSVEGSPVAQAKARALAERRGVQVRFEVADFGHWQWPEREFDVIAAIFVQFAGPDLRARMFEGMRRALKPGGLLLLEGYGPKQLEYRTGGPPLIEHLYTEEMLREAFAGMEILELKAYDAVIDEGSGHSGQSALVDLVARQPER